MTCRTAIVSDVYFVRWISPETSDLDRIAGEVEKATKGQGHPLLALIAIVPQGTSMPGGDFRKDVADRMPRIQRNVDNNMLVIEGSGFKGAAMRGLAAGIRLLAGERKAYVLDSVEAALTKLKAEAKLKHEPASMLAQARNLGIVE